MQNITTIVSGFIANINKCGSIDKYLKFGQILLKIKVPKVIFVDSQIIDRITNPLPEYNTFIPFKFSDMYYYQYLETLKKTVHFDTNPDKDTVEYMMVQCYKTEWVKMAAELNPYKTDQFMWIDFGIYHILEEGEPTESCIDKFTRFICFCALYRTYTIRIPYMNLWFINSYDPYKNPCWYFAGGLFGGNKDNIIKFANYMKEYCLKIITEKNWLMWEINIWAFIHKEHHDLFDLYYGGHDASIFTNYIDPRMTLH